MAPFVISLLLLELHIQDARRPRFDFLTDRTLTMKFVYNTGTGLDGLDASQKTGLCGGIMMFVFVTAADEYVLVLLLPLAAQPFSGHAE